MQQIKLEQHDIDDCPCPRCTMLKDMNRQYNELCPICGKANWICSAEQKRQCGYL